MALTLEHSLCDVVVENPAAAAIFETLDIDYYCRGGRALGDVLSETGISFDDFIGELNQSACLNVPNTSTPDWRVASLRSLIRHIVSTHHAYLQYELPVLDKWITRISAKHPEERELLSGLQQAIQRFHRNLEVQMQKEEAISFPAIWYLEGAAASDAPRAGYAFGSLANLSRAMEEENNRTAYALREIRSLTNNYVCPPHTSRALEVLFRRLRALAANTRQHLHLENNILFPRAIKLDQGETPCS